MGLEPSCVGEMVQGLKCLLFGLFAGIVTIQGDPLPPLSGRTRVETSYSPTEIKLGWLDENTLTILFADNTTDKIFLSPANNIPGVIVPCVFSGSLGRDLEAVVSVTGCKDRNVTVSIASDKFPGGLIDLALSADGETYTIDSHFERAEDESQDDETPEDQEQELPKIPENPEPELPKMPQPQIPRTARQLNAPVVDLRMTSETEVKLVWTSAREIDVVFADGTQDKIHLMAVTNLDGEETPCLFAGSLDKDQDSEVTILGCKGDDEVLVEIASEKEAGGVLDLILTKDGNTYEVTHGDWNADGQWNEGEEGSLIAGPDHPSPDDNIAAQIPAEFSGSLPRSVTLEISLKYDNSLLGRFGNDHTRVKHWLSRVVELAKPKMALLDVKVHLKVVGQVRHYGKSIRASDYWIRHITSTNEDKGKKGPISYFSAGNGAGIAWVGSACHIRSGMQININEHVSWGNPELVTAKTLAHELGHNLGMSHDFDQIHGGNGRPGSNLRGCEGTGIMSYGSKSNPRNPSASPIAWSTCSNSDFSKWYRRDGHSCLRPGTGGGNGGGGAGCKAPEQGYLGAGNNVADYGGIQSAGPDDCAGKCSAVSGCKAWTLHKPSNYCWLKTTGTSKGIYQDWLRGEPCEATSQLKGCQCNGHMSAMGYGECNSRAKCGTWCYVDDDAPCLETNPSLNGEPHRWTCEACNSSARLGHLGLLGVAFISLSVAWSVSARMLDV